MWRNQNQKTHYFGEMALKCATLFSSAELFGVGAEAAGLEHSFGIELDPRIAAVAWRNGFNVLVGDMRDFAFPWLVSVFGSLFLLHASPPCTRASRSNSTSREARLDLELAQATVRAITRLRPRFFTLENVVEYRHFAAFALIVDSLRQLGYRVKFWNINFADYGVPQTRRRLILVAHRDGGRVVKPPPTHAKQRTLFCQRWIGWHEALRKANVLDSLPNTGFTATQVRRLQRYGFDPFKEVGFLADVRNTKRKNTVRRAHEPSFTIVATMSKGHARGRLPDGRYFKMNQSAYAAIQTVPSSYQFGPSKMLNQRIIGNGVPPKFAEILCKQLMEIALWKKSVTYLTTNS